MGVEYSEYYLSMFKDSELEAEQFYEADDYSENFDLLAVNNDIPEEIPNYNSLINETELKYNESNIRYFELDDIQGIIDEDTGIDNYDFDDSYFDIPENNYADDMFSFQGELNDNILDIIPENNLIETIEKDALLEIPEEQFKLYDDVNDDFNGELSDEQIDEVYNGSDTYDFGDKDLNSDPERLAENIERFSSENWENLSLNDKKEAMSDLAQYVTDVLGLENPPEIVFYDNHQDGDYGGFCASDNTLQINEYMLYQNDEAADTVAHELWHAYQHQCAENPKTTKDLQYSFGFENYIRPEDDMEMYSNQLVEAEARAFARQIKDKLN